VKVKCCQFKFWMLYCASVVLTGKLFRIKTCLWLNPISVNMLCKSKSSQLVYFLQPLKVLPSSAYHLGIPYKRWTMLLFMPPWPSHTWVRITCIFSKRMYILMCTRSCSACRLHPFSIRLGRAQLSSGHSKLLWSFSGSTPFDWTYFRLKTATFEIFINDKFPPELSLLAAQNETQLASSETWAWRYQFSISRLNAYVPTECNYFKVVCTGVKYLITRTFNAIE